MSDSGRNDPRTIDPNLVAEVWSDALPSEDPVLFGHVSIEPSSPVEARSLQTLIITYTVGRHGMDDTGGLRVVLRSVGDSGRLQVDDPSAPNYATARASNGAGLKVSYMPTGAWRPRTKCLQIQVIRGCLREGETVEIVIGDTSGGSPGAYMQTHCETAFEYKVLADVCATGHYVPLAQVPTVNIRPGRPVLWRLVLPTLRRPGERFQFGIKAEDKWGNPTDQAAARLRIKASLPVENLPAEVDYPLGSKSMAFEGLSVHEPGTLHITVEDESGKILATTNPLLIRAGEISGYWADLHGQSGESVGINTSVEYFEFARDRAFLDATSHQANDFQVNKAFWTYLNELTAQFHEDHRFVTFPGYEWSGNTAVGGDRNVFFREEGRQIRRSSHALLPDRSDIATDATDANTLFEVLLEEDCVIFAHVGGRYADIDFAHDGRLEHSMELHSAWGSFEWLIEDCFRLGYRVGVVCNSDGHKGRPGASYPGASTFGAYGGLTCYYTNELTRDGIFDSLRRRHHYGTTGNRLHLEVDVDFQTDGECFTQDPKVFPGADSQRVPSVMMGDIARTSDTHVSLRVNAVAGTAIERIEIRNGCSLLQTLRAFDEEDLGERIRVLWSGAEYRGRGRETNWAGEIHFDGRRIRRMEKINAWNHERRLEQVGENTVAFNTITTGNFSGFDVWLDDSEGGQMRLDANLVSDEIELGQLGLDDTVFDAGGLGRKITAFRLPETNPHHELAATVEVPLEAGKDNPLWVCVTTEDGFQAWSSPIYLFD